jgi:hypothetical protein
LSTDNDRFASKARSGGKAMQVTQRNLSPGGKPMYPNLQIPIGPDAISTYNPSPTNSSANNTALAMSVSILPLLVLVIAIGYRNYRMIRLRQKVEYLERLWRIQNPIA